MWLMHFYFQMLYRGMQKYRKRVLRRVAAEMRLINLISVDDTAHK